MMINPGTGPVPGRVTLKNAYANLERLLEDAGLSHAFWIRDVDAREDDGRFAFYVSLGTEVVSVLMPGCPLEIVSASDGFPPRVYVNGSSYWFNIAAGVLKFRASEASL